MLYDHMWTKDAGYYDLPFHSNIINSFVLGINSQRHNLCDIRFLIDSGKKLVYPIVPDFYASGLILTSMTSHRYALFIPSLCIAFSLICALYRLVNKYMRRPGLMMMHRTFIYNFYHPT
jgi:hypothetical protein